eukprot:Blabericola_migrator_1__1378@NODE_1359_length_4725_cov_105_142121_g912_i0_p2_GENE_NODE_1359_length_4725_cov_105_142121_g912_i0NODE_1359_length_4725_cov_105_142121_g912_i0_p2_ORF_typecomplete_len321_score81_83PUB/PF09409_10/2_6e16UBA/PF00627_31/0_0037Tsp45I/PF06300_12/1_5e03Tsp45I/PF06300_12/0_28SMC_N/PF02463_19/0_28DUF759/PF05537_11/3_8_NODE_1359_length_4725_cov_105_142121_g912_i011282090
MSVIKQVTAETQGQLRETNSAPNASHENAAQETTAPETAHTDTTANTPECPAGAVEINEEDINILVEQGIDYNRAALALAQGGSLEKAVEWLEANPSVQAKRKMDPKEAEQKAIELQRKLRERRIERERVEAIEREKERIASTKALMDAKRAFEEAERKRMAQQRIREKEQHRLDEERQRALLAAAYRERFGVDPPSREEMAENEINKAPPKERITIYLQRLKTQMEQNPEMKPRIQTCLKTVRIYCNNAKANPTQKKYHAISKLNSAFKDRVAGFPDAINVLQTVGFVEDGDEYKIQQIVPDGFLLGQAITFLDLLIEN